jgi:hypothetical protein
MHRILATIVLVLALSTSGYTALLAAAQEATPTPGKDRLLADTMGLPELAITATPSSYEGVPAETAAGRYVVTLTAAPGLPFGAGLEFLMLPEGMTFADFMAILTGEAPATPMASGEEQGAPAFYYQTYLPGGLSADRESTSQGIFDLRPGVYAVWSGGDPDAPQPPVEMRVTGEAATPAASAEPAASATISLHEYGFQLDGQLVTGPQVVKVTNIGAQPHFMILINPGVPVTKEQIGMILDAEMAGTPTADAAAAAGMSNPDEWAFSEYAGTISNGATEWIAFDLDPGTYVLVCFIPDIESGVPHAYLGMYDVVTVGESATPAA